MHEIASFKLPKVRETARTSSCSTYYLISGLKNIQELHLWCQPEVPPGIVNQGLDPTFFWQAGNLSVDSLSLSLGPGNGSKNLRQQISGLYDKNVTAENILPTNGATGANSLVFQTLLSPEDHIIAMYPSYTQLLSIPKAAVGGNISYSSLNLNNQAQGDLEQLKDMVKPTTKMIVLNNPNNPLGTVLSLEMLYGIMVLACEYGLTILVDEIFRLLFHNYRIPPSFVELSENNNNIVVTSSMSKVWGTFWYTCRLDGYSLGSSSAYFRRMIKTGP